MRVLRDGGTALYQVTQNSWRIIEVVRSSTNLGVTATEWHSPKIEPIDATANPDTPKPATHNELQLRLVALREKLSRLGALGYTHHLHHLFIHVGSVIYIGVAAGSEKENLLVSNLQ